MKKNLKLQWNNLFLVLMLTPFLVVSQAKNVLSVSRVFPKMDKVLEFEKVLATHAQKYHTDDQKWTVYQVQSGPDAGGYHIVEGPKSWQSEDMRGDINVAHNNDWHKSIAIYLTDRYSNSYFVYQDSLSTSLKGEKYDKIQVTRVYPKIGCGGKVYKIIKNLKTAWEANGQSISVYESSGSGKGQYAIVRRFTKGLKEKEEGFNKPFKADFEKIYGSGSYDIHMDNIREYTDEVWSELLFQRADLSSK